MWRAIFGIYFCGINSKATNWMLPISHKFGHGSGCLWISDRIKPPLLRIIKHNGILEIVPRWHRFINTLWIILWNNDTHLLKSKTSNIVMPFLNFYDLGNITSLKSFMVYCEDLELIVRFKCCTRDVNFFFLWHSRKMNIWLSTCVLTMRNCTRTFWNPRWK
jgi:hypothetical protein